MAATAKPRLRDLPDVNAPSPANGQALVWDAATSRWLPATVAGGGGAPSGPAGGDLGGTFPNPVIGAGAVTQAKASVGTGSTQLAGGNDSRFPTAGQKNALAGTVGTPGTGNEYTTKQDRDAIQAGLDAAVARLDATDAAGGIANLKKAGAKGDGLIFADAAITAGTNTVSSVAAQFTAMDIGKRIGISGAGVTTQGGVLAGYIKTVAAGVASIVTTPGGSTAANATNTVSGATVIFGTDDSAAIQAQVIIGKQLYAPKGIYVTVAPVTVTNGTALTGDGWGISIFCPINDGSYFLTHPGAASLANPTKDITLKDFEVDCRGMYSTAGYGSQFGKALDLPYSQRAGVINVYVHDSLATAFAFDYSVDRAVLIGNFAERAGRLNDGTQPGGSGFGMGTKGTTNEEPSIIANNHAIGCGRYGIFLENQTANSSNTPMSRGWLIANNYCRANKAGIGDCGSRWTRIVNNYCQGNTTAGVELSGGTISAGRPGWENLVSNNILVENLHGILIDGTDVDDPRGYHKINDNIIAYNTGNGIRMILADRDARGMEITDNSIHDNNLSGIRVYYSIMTSGAGGVGGSPAVWNGATAYVVGDVVYYITGGVGNVYRSKTAHTSATTPDVDTTNWQVLGLIRWSELSNNRLWNNGVSNVANDKDGMRLQVAVRDTGINNNRCFDNGSSHQAFGLVFDAPKTAGSISNNNLRGNLSGGWSFTAAAFRDDAATRISGNIGTLSGGGPLNPAPISETPGASPWTRAASKRPETLFLSGGTVSSVTVGGQQVAATSNVAIDLEEGDAPVVTYTAAPTVAARAR